MDRHDELFAAAGRVLGGAFGQFALPEADAIVASHGRGAYLYDLRGRRYLDYLLGSGPLLLGHARPEVVAAIQGQAAKGSHFYVLSEPGIELAERIVEIVPCAEKIKYASSGSESTFQALRMARAFSGKTKILKFEGGFHGTHDYAMMSSFHASPEGFPHPAPDSIGIPDGIRDTVLVSRWNDRELTRSLVEQHAHELAVVVCEPMQRAVAAAPGFLQFLRELTEANGLLLMFDEMVTGFRLALGGGQQRYGVVPDLATFGKAMTNGMAMTCIAGRSDVLAVADVARAGSDSYSYFGGTLNGHALAAAAGLAVLDVLSGPGVYQRLDQMGDTLRHALREAAARHGLPAQVLGEGPVFQIVFSETPVVDFETLATGDRTLSREFGLGCLRAGILNNGGGKFYISLAHSDVDLATTVEVFDQVLAAMAAERAPARQAAASTI
ncbi:MAG TPA: aminotransferase class III-fold pyridoxal phosphate-dependent enzyme [Acidimicrobiales bacterium]|jgi:glutamate-1-semialdehyde 2,1-aminomutase|nr:aminotransferase class III-fold pyridoxal phosphate-dependent enzyme [Acidimicrobiales bacterium]